MQFGSPIDAALTLAPLVAGTETRLRNPDAILARALSDCSSQRPGVYVDNRQKRQKWSDPGFRAKVV